MLSCGIILFLVGLNWMDGSTLPSLGLVSARRARVNLFLAASETDEGNWSVRVCVSLLAVFNPESFVCWVLETRASISFLINWQHFLFFSTECILSDAVVSEGADLRTTIIIRHIINTILSDIVNL